MPSIKWTLLIAAFASVTACAAQTTPYSGASAAPPFSITSDEGTYANPTEAPRGAQGSISESGIPGESGLDSASSELSGR